MVLAKCPEEIVSGNEEITLRRRSYGGGLVGVYYKMEVRITW